MAIDRELRLQRRGLEEVAAGVKALVKARGLEEVKSIDLDSRSRGRQSSLEASRTTETTIDTRRMAVARGATLGAPPWKNAFVLKRGVVEAERQ